MGAGALSWRVRSWDRSRDSVWGMGSAVQAYIWKDSAKILAKMDRLFVDSQGNVGVVLF